MTNYALSLNFKVTWCGRYLRGFPYFFPEGKIYRGSKDFVVSVANASNGTWIAVANGTFRDPRPAGQSGIPGEKLVKRLPGRACVWAVCSVPMPLLVWQWLRAALYRGDPRLAEWSFALKHCAKTEM